LPKDPPGQAHSEIAAKNSAENQPEILLPFLETSRDQPLSNYPSHCLGQKVRVLSTGQTALRRDWHTNPLSSISIEIIQTFCA
jgi:hypothetical protein